MPVICIGPICVPLWPIVAITLKPLWDRVLPDSFKLYLNNLWSRVTAKICPRRNERSISSRESASTKSDDAVIIIVESRKMFHNLTRAENPPVIFKFTAEWCGPCQQINPSVARLATKYQGRVLFAEIDIENLEDLALELGVASIPAFHGYSSGCKIDSFTGANAQKLEELVKTVVNASRNDKKEPKKAK